jgi:predicted protein tyrosine phosphatase
VGDRLDDFRLVFPYLIKDIRARLRPGHPQFLPVNVHCEPGVSRGTKDADYRA